MTTEILRAEITIACRPFLDDDQIMRLGAVLDKKLHGLEIRKAETALAVESPPGERALREYFVSKAMRGCSKATLLGYRYEIDRMLRYIGKDLLEITTADIRFYMAHLQLDLGLKRSSIASKRTILNSLFTWLHENEHIKKNPVAKIEQVMFQPGTREPFNQEEVERLRDAAVGDLRTAAVVEVLVSTGIRLGELAGLKRSDVDRITRSITVTGKGSKTRTVYLSPRALLRLEAYWATRTDATAEAFVSSRKPYGKMSKAGLYKIIKELGEKAGIENVHPHRFRHTAATTALRHGMELDVVRQMLGHNSADTTLIYAKRDREELKQSMYKYMVG